MTDAQRRTKNRQKVQAWQRTAQGRRLLAARQARYYWRSGWAVQRKLRLGKRRATLTQKLGALKEMKDAL